MTTTTATPPRKARCRYLDTNKRGSTDRCQSESLGGEYAEIQLCLRHMGLALEFLRRTGATS